MNYWQQQAPMGEVYELTTNPCSVQQLQQLVSAGGVQRHGHPGQVTEELWSEAAWVMKCPVMS